MAKSPKLLAFFFLLNLIIVNDRKLSRIALAGLVFGGLVFGCYSYWKNLPPKETGQEPDGGEEETGSETFSITWTKDNGARVTDGSVPYIYKLPDGRYRLYYCGQGGILSAISNNGLDFTKDSGVRIAPASGFESVVCDPTLVELADGRVRMYYKGADSSQGGPGQSIHKIFSAVSTDGLTFTREGLRIDSEKTDDRGWASVPEAIELSDGRVRIYYVTGDSEANNGIASAISSDGLAFTKESGVRVPNFVDPAILQLADGTFLMLVANPGFYQEVPSGIYSFTSADGLAFGNRQTVLAGNNIFDPTVVFLDGQTLRVYFGKIPADLGLPSTESATGIIQ